MTRASDLEIPRQAIYAGTFDPPTIGHLSVIEQGVELFGGLHIAVGVNPKKLNSTMFTEDERLEMLDDYTKDMPNITLGRSGLQYLVDYARDRKATHLLRGLRSGNDFNSEYVVASYSGDIDKLTKAEKPKTGPPIRTVFVPCPPELVKVSSSSVKELVGYVNWEEAAGLYVSPLVVAGLKRKFEALIAERA